MLIDDEFSALDFIFDAHHSPLLLSIIADFTSIEDYSTRAGSLFSMTFALDWEVLSAPSSLLDITESSPESAPEL